MAACDFPLPTILDCAGYCVQKPVLSYGAGLRNVRHYELDYNMGGERTMLVDGKEYRVTEGCITCRKPGQTVSAVGTYNMFMLTLSYSQTADSHARKCWLDNPVEPASDCYIWNKIPVCFYAAHHAEIFMMYRRLSVLWRQPERTEETRQLLFRLLHQVVADACAITAKESPQSTVDILLEHMHENYDRALTLEELSTLVHLNKSYLVRLFRKETGQTPIDYLTRFRLSQAQRLLASTDLKVAETARQCGFESASYFIRRFRMAYGCTPEQYRMRKEAEFIQE